MKRNTVFYTIVLMCTLTTSCTFFAGSPSVAPHIDTLIAGPAKPPADTLVLSVNKP